jgi:hypothetical protein
MIFYFLILISMLFIAYLQTNTKSLVLNYFLTIHHIKHSLAKSIFFFILFFVKHQYHAKIDDQIDKALLSMTTGLINKLVSVLEATLGKLGRYDEGSLIGSFLSFTVGLRQKILWISLIFLYFFRTYQDQAKNWDQVT